MLVFILCVNTTKEISNPTHIKYVVGIYISKGAFKN